MTTLERDVCDRARQALEDPGNRCNCQHMSWEHRGPVHPCLECACLQFVSDTGWELVRELVAEVDRLRANQRVETVEDWHGKAKGGN